MMNFLKGYDWLLLGTVFVGGIAALIVFYKVKHAMDKKAMNNTTQV